MVDMQCIAMEGVTWKRGLRWRDGWRANGGVGPTWWETPNQRDCGIQRKKCSRSTITDHLGLAWQVTPARSEIEGRWLSEWAARHGWQRQWQKEKYCGAMETTEGLHLSAYISSHCPSRSLLLVVFMNSKEDIVCPRKWPNLPNQNCTYLKAEYLSAQQL